MIHTKLLRPFDILAILYGLSFGKFIPVLGSSEICLLFFIIFFCIRVREIIYSKRFKKLELLLYLYLFLELANNALHQGAAIWYGLCVNSIAMILFFEICICKKDIRSIVLFTMACNVWAFISLLDVIENAVLRIVALNQEYKLCGYDNGLAAFLLPVIGLNLALYKMVNNKIFFIFSIIAGLQMFFVWSATGMVGVLLFYVIFFGSKFEIFRNVITPNKIFIGTWVIFFLFVAFQSYDNAFVRWFVVDLLKKNMTLSMRTKVWKISMEYFLGSPILGYGNNIKKKMQLLGVAYGHNIYLDILIQTGILGLIIFSIVLLMFLYIYNSKKKKGITGITDYMLACFAFAMIFVWQFESYNNYYGFPLFFILLVMKDFGEGKTLSRHTLRRKDDSNIYFV